ncbi:MAG: hypothetical protein O7A63_11585 [Acidobacteria bacterium]|nr:hypothetical protein [Acidobacteriota bacterium]
MTGLVRRSPLSAVYRSTNASIIETAGWEIAEHFGDAVAERRGLETGSVLVDWSHIGKISLRGPGAEENAARIASTDPLPAPPGALGIANGISGVLLRLAADEFLILCGPGEEHALLIGLDRTRTAVLDQTGGYGALLLAGPRRNEVLERSTAIDLRAGPAAGGSIVQTSVHFVPCTIHSAPNRNILIQSRDYTESLHLALLDVGRPVGLVPAGIGCVPVEFGGAGG